MTSPPYGAAQKYIRSTSLESGWLGFTTDKGTIDLERASVGREHLTKDERLATIASLGNGRLTAILNEIAEDHPVRASIYTNYFLDMERVLRNAALPAVNCKRLVVICGTNTVRGKHIETHEVLSEIALTKGFKRTLSLRDAIKGRTLLTTRNSDGTPAPAEFIEVFERDI
ncbi:hypothetical protein [Pseudarthrobacter sulfonivorans]|uniref:hypothetical protein n=1 Tax=Pseudarthrobacter sulfonivorans TaxID=121292 RepID=UPI002858A3F7|nr:hypothetical protein [Pseudarthrobacter sulfonivorans]MDR6417722.1 hypothetical protein [Pseudarthrobacter sulfonivorans]